MLHEPKTSPDALLTTAELARILRVPVTTVYAWRHRGCGPPGYRVGRHTRYRGSDVSAWLEARKSGANP